MDLGKYFPLSNDLVFGKVMANKETCKLFLQAVLPEMEIEKIEMAQPQERVKDFRDEHGGVFDIYALDNQGRHYDIEVQVVPEDYLINRANFYLSLLDFAKRPAGPKYDEIKDVIVIFVCMFDPFDRDQKMYHFRMYDPKLKMELTPNRRLVFLNCMGTKGKVNASVQGYIQAMNGDLSSNEPLVQAVRNDLEVISRDRIEAVRIMDIAEKAKIREEYYKKRYREEGLKEGRAVGLQEGLQEGLKKGKKEGEEIGRQKERERYLINAIQNLKAKEIDFETAKDNIEIIFGQDFEEKQIIAELNRVYGTHA